MIEGSKKRYVDETRQSSPAGLIIRQKEPTNLDMPFDQVDTYLTPTELFYIRSHFRAPKLDAADYRLSIDGAVRNPLSETRTATLECAGNGRVFLVPQARGAQWELGAVGNAEWTGVPLRAVLERAGLEDNVCEVVLEGADRGTPTEEPIPPGPISYARSVPREKAIQPEVLIAYQMNGRDLSRDLEYPVRAIVARSLWHGFRQVADAHPGCARAVSGLLADIRLRLLDFFRWQAGAAPVSRK